MDKIIDFPLIKATKFIPQHLALWTQSYRFYYDKTLHFFTDDYKFNCLWNNPKRYNKIIKKYKAVITPDFSLYQDMPEPLKIYNTYKNRWLGNYWQSLGLTVIPSVNWADYRSFSYCFEGIEKESIIAITTNTIRKRDLSYSYFILGIKEIINYLKPTKILVYGTKFYDELKSLNPQLFKFYHRKSVH